MSILVTGGADYIGSHMVPAGRCRRRRRGASDRALGSITIWSDIRRSVSDRPSLQCALTAFPKSRFIISSAARPTSLLSVMEHLQRNRLSVPQLRCIRRAPASPRRCHVSHGTSDGELKFGTFLETFVGPALSRRNHSKLSMYCLEVTHGTTRVSNSDPAQPE